MRFPLDTSNRQAAAAKAARIFTFLTKNGWETAIAKFKPHTIAKPQDTVGELIAASERLSTARPQSKHAYAKAFRRIVAGVADIPDGRKYDGEGKGHATWREAVDAVKLSRITPARIVAWKNAFLVENGKTPEQKRRAITTVNSLIRNSKALYAKKFLHLLRDEIALPDPLPFDEVPMEKRPSMRYRSKIDAQAILADAREELATEDPEAFKVVLLALVCGLRISEIDHLMWEAFDFSASILLLEDTEFHQMKSEDSAGEVDLGETMVATFRGFMAKATGDFVIESQNAARLGSRRYRCDNIFNRVRMWLRAQGVTGTKPIHTLRKEIGSLIAAEHGIFEASRYLRHSDIRITSEIYADKKKVVVPSCSVAHYTV